MTHLEYIGRELRSADASLRDAVVEAALALDHCLKTERGEMAELLRAKRSLEVAADAYRASLTPPSPPVCEPPSDRAITALAYQYLGYRCPADESVIRFARALLDGGKV